MLSNEEFIRRRKNAHQKDEYDYSCTLYKGERNDVEAICPIHGKFKINARRFSNGQKCPKCALEDYKNKKTNTIEDFAKKCVERFGDIYDFSKAVYKGSHSTLKIKCKVCGAEFSKVSCDMLTSKNGGCPHFRKKEEKTISYKEMTERLTDVQKTSYYYKPFEGDKKYSRQKFQKKKLVKKYGCPETMTEKEFCYSKKWYRIYDCGNFCFKIKNY